ncbi:MAG TPA: tRNA (N(6)-L-threonylcarbamoyladenosine(37)-C(2))-methylthiotransferase MtaB [Candidatus Hydrogenedens sp.]|mgnify:CR=1 FL=1|nr:tRNA (N(6)-L-threonylcarbamoyladenosine(37)-C(2))-methylthiotransferase MtaB [Candidatus Hydrogenedens sp.]
MKTVHIHTLGCRLNQSESDTMLQHLYELGYEVATKDEPADLCIIHTCAVTHAAEVKCRKVIRQTIQRNPNAEVVVIGCYVEKDLEKLKEIEGIDLIVDNKRKMDWFSHIKGTKQNTPIVLIGNSWELTTLNDYAHTKHVSLPGFHRANIKIQEGCEFFCSYCIIPTLRGPFRSRNYADILQEVVWRTEGGTKEIVLTGINIGNYNYEGKNLINLLDMIYEQVGNKIRIRLSSIELNSLNEDFLMYMKDVSHPLVPYLHIPLQSGSNTILQLMNRKYTREAYHNFVLHAVETVPDIGISADVLTGFSGETSQLFDETLDFLENLPVYFLHIFPYSPREGTPSYSFPNQVPIAEIGQRVHTLLTLSKKKRKQFYEKAIGSTRHVLFEEKENKYWQGYTDNYIRIIAESQECLENKLCKVKLESIFPYHIKGSVVEIEG